MCVCVCVCGPEGQLVTVRKDQSMDSSKLLNTKNNPDLTIRFSALLVDFFLYISIFINTP